MKKTLIAAAVLLSGQVMAGSLTIQELGDTTETGDFPVCSNGAGKLLPCADDVVVPPPPDAYVGFWSGRMIHDPRSTDTDCADTDANVTFRVVAAGYNTSGYLGYIGSTTIRRDSGSLDITSLDANIRYDGYVADYYWPFGIRTDFNILFNDKGSAEGVWAESSYDCYGTWTFTKD